MNSKISKYQPKKKYQSDGNNKVICCVRKRLIKSNPEEDFRQAFIAYLIQEKGYPINRIEIEHSLAKIEKGDKRRADIVVYDCDDKANAILVIECKKPKQTIIDRDLLQVKGYSDILNSEFILLTNGEDHHTYRKLGDTYDELTQIPNYTSLLNKKYKLKKIKHNNFEIKEYFVEINSKIAHNQLKKMGYISSDTHKSLHPLITQLVVLFLDRNSIYEKKKMHGFSILKDLGNVKTSFGNAGGGSWPGYYKKLLIADEKGNHFTIGLTIAGGGGKHKYTYLIVSIDDELKSHNSLQLNLDKNVTISDSGYIIKHDGKLTNGNKGSVKHDVVLNHVKKYAPNLINSSNEIELGRLEKEKLTEPDSKNAIQLIKNLIQYAIVRDRLRAKV